MKRFATKTVLGPTLLGLTLLGLTACGTPQEQCVNRATRDMRVVDRLIAETEGNIDRGYAYEEVTVYQTEWVDCTPRVAAGQPAPPPQMCLDDVPRTERKAVAIDLVAEAAKLDSLKAKRAQQSRTASSAIAACKSQYPE
jgi:hypothetical protein